MNELKFENTVKLTEAEYVAVWAVTRAWRMSRTVKFGVFVAAGIAFLFTPYTLLLGLVLLGLAVLALLIPGIVPFGARQQFRGHKYLKEPLTYGVTDQKLWVKGDKIDASVPWSMLATWREKEGWLVLTPHGIPPLYLSLARLTAEGLYGRVRALAASNAPEFNTSNPPN
jgi:hypothetical protein